MLSFYDSVYLHFWLSPPVAWFRIHCPLYMVLRGPPCLSPAFSRRWGSTGYLLCASDNAHKSSRHTSNTPWLLLMHKEKTRRLLTLEELVAWGTVSLRLDPGCSWWNSNYKRTGRTLEAEDTQCSIFLHCAQLWREASRKTIVVWPNQEGKGINHSDLENRSTGDLNTERISIQSYSLKSD